MHLLAANHLTAGKCRNNQQQQHAAAAATQQTILKSRQECTS